MKRNQPFLLLVTVAILAIAFSSFGPGGKNPFPGYTPLENGSYIFFYNKGSGTTVTDTGGAIFVKIVFKTAQDSVFLNINEAAHAESYPLRVDKSQFKGDFLDVFSKLHVGDSVSLFVRLDSLKKYYPDEFNFSGEMERYDKMQYLGFAVKVDSIYSRDVVVKLRADADLETAKQKIIKDSLAAIEPATIKKYIADNKITAKPSPDGLYLIERAKGSGKNVQAGQLVKVRYACKYTEGEVFDSNMKPGEALYEFVVGSGDAIAGLDEGVRFMKKGGKATLIIPSKLAYGEGTSEVKPYATLIFDVEVVEVWDQK